MRCLLESWIVREQSSLTSLPSLSQKGTFTKFKSVIVIFVTVHTSFFGMTVTSTRPLLANQIRPYFKIRQL
jgi:hypothetical protein